MKQQGLVLVDIQNDYFAGGAMPLVGMEKASGNVERILRTFREEGHPVFHVRHLSVRPGATFFLPGTVGADIHRSVAPLPGETVIEKMFPNSFRNTPLHEMLTEQGVTDLVICGAMTHMCIDATARAAFDLGFRCTVVDDGCATRDLVYRGVEIEASMVHGAFMTALSMVYAAVRTAEDVIGTQRA
jgi:nicotinamidase-related amidase